MIFALIFLAQLGAFIAIAVISLRALPASESTGGLGSVGNATTINASIGWLLAILAGAGFVFSGILLFVVKTFTKIILEICLLLSLITTIGFVPCTPVLYRALKCLTLKGRPQLRHLHVHAAILVWRYVQRRIPSV